MKNDHRKQQAIINILHSTPVGLTAAELRTRLHVHSIKLAEHEVIKELRTLQSEERVRLDRNRWNLVDSTRATLAPTSNETRNGIQLTTTGVAICPAPTDLNKAEWRPSTSDVFNPDIASGEHKENLGSWGTFRRLLNYYSDCVRNNDGFEASGFSTDYGKSFFFLRQIGNWYPKVGNPWRRMIPLGPNLQDFIKRIGHLEEDILLLGYPLQVWTKSEGEGSGSVFLKPIFTYQLRIESIDSTGIQILCENPWPEVNLDWLSYAFKKPNQQRTFLSICGLMDRGSGDESFGDIGRGVFMPDLQTLAKGVIASFPEKIREPLQAQNTIALNLPEQPASGIYNRAVLMIGNRSRYTRFLLKELKRIESCSDEQLDQTALKFIFKTRDDNTIESNQANQASDLESDEIQEVLHEGAVLEIYPLNGEQRRSIASLLTSNLTVITGPPGTGKSQVVSTAMANARLRDKTVIFSSRNHKAIDAVIERLTFDNQRSLVIRANSKDDPFLRFGFEEAIAQLLSEEYDQTASGRWEGIKNRFMNLLDRRSEWGGQADKIQDLRDQLGSLEQQMENISESWTSDMIYELNNTATVFPTEIVKQIEHVIEPLRSANKKANSFIRFVWWFKSFFIRSNLQLLNKYFRKNLGNWPNVSTNLYYEGLCKLAVQLPQLNMVTQYCKLRIQAQPIEEELKKLPLIEELVNKIKKVSEELKGMQTDVLSFDLERRTGLPPDADREALASLKSALRGLDHAVADREDREAVQSALSDNARFLLQHFPLWAVTNLAVGSRFPLIGGLFDVAIIDEASQCDIPSAIPILFRAKRVGVVGDPRQLSHVTKITRTQDVLIRKRHGITQVNNEQRFAYPDTSLYNLFAQTNYVNPVLLKETYRSVAEIAEYSNQNFYGGSLRVLTQADCLKIPRNMRVGIHWSEIVSNITSAGLHGCFAPAEVTTVVNILKELLIENQFEGTVGIVTPFHQQKVRIHDAVAQEIPHAFRVHTQLIIDTAHGFQGDERDVMIMSLCGGPKMPPGSLGFIRQTANLMNVAVSRARAVLHVVGNKSWALECGIPHIARLALPIEATIVRERTKSRWYPHESPWEKNLFDALRERGLEPEPQHPEPEVGRRLDLALIRKDKKFKGIDVEVDGDRHHRNPDGTRKRDDIWRDIQLQGAGWKVMRFWVYQLRENLDDCVNRIIKAWR